MSGFATIGPRHAGDTPPEASYGHNSPHLHAETHLEHDHIGRDTLNTADTSAPHVPKAQSTSATTAHFRQFSPKRTTV